MQDLFTKINEAKEFLIKKFGSIESVKPGVYAIPTKTPKGTPAFMKVEITPKMEMKDFHLFNDESLTQSCNGE